MPTFTVQRTIKAPIADVFDWLSTATNYAKHPLVLAAKLVRPGSDGAFGLGALREITTPVMWFQEEITAFDRPNRFDYLIVKAVPPMTHRGGHMSFREVPGGTEVTWTTAFDLPVPVVGELAGQAAAAVAKRGFTAILETADKALVPA